MSTCFFIGHRDAPDSILPSLSAAIETRIVEDGVDQFVVGNYGRFDLLAAQAVRKAKKQHPDILLFYLRPYHPAERSFTPAGFDGSLGYCGAGGVLVGGVECPPRQKAAKFFQILWVFL